MNAIRYTRIPAAFLLALLLTAAMFSALNGLTSATYLPTFTPSAPIIFTQPRPDTPAQEKQREKPQLIKPVKPDDIRITAQGKGDRLTTVAVTETVVPDTAMSPVTGAAAVDRDVTPMVRISPIYPPRAQTAGTEGWVQVRFNISASGSVTDVTVVDSEPGTIFDKAALEAVARWRYNPKVQDGAPVERRGVETVLRFQLDQ